MVIDKATSAATTHSVRAIVCMLVGSALLALNDALMKSLTDSYPVGQLLFVRGLFIYPWVLLLAYRQGGLQTLRVKSMKGQFLRGSCVIAGSFLFVTGLRYLPLADAVAIAFTGPMFITAMAPIVLGESVGWRRWAAVLLGLVGVLFMARPTGEAVQWAMLLPLAAALCGGIRDLVTRRISQSETSVAVLFVTTTAVTLAGLVTAPFGWSDLLARDLWVFIASGALVAGAHYLMIEAFRLGEAALVAPFKYTSMVWAILFGFIFFADLPDGWTLFGAAIVVFAGLYIMHRETRFGRRPFASARTPPRL
ncbi:MAG: DMT family transporter [Hyphomicrobiaceae bacterium]